MSCSTSASLDLFYFSGGHGVGGRLESWAEEGNLHVQVVSSLGAIILKVWKTFKD